VTHADREPWCVWATPTGRTTFGPVSEFGDVRDAPGGRSLDGNWVTTATQHVVSGKQGALVPGLWLSGNSLLEWIGLGGRGGESWVSTTVERTGPDGVKATAFVRSSVSTGLDGPCPEASVAGTWDLVDGSGARRHVCLNSDGLVEGDPGVIWGVHDGALVIDRGPIGSSDAHFVETFVLSEDRRAIDGTLLDPVHGTKVD
jgi:hypothetical protein